MRTLTCCHTGREKTGAKTPRALLKAIGKESMAILSVEKNTGFHCRSILTQIVINGQSRAKRLFEKFRPLRADATSGASWRGKSSPHCSWAIVHSPLSRHHRESVSCSQALHDVRVGGW